jgi:phage/plasmid-like protein (TIGR03299 family)
MFSNNQSAWHQLGNVVEKKIYSTSEAIQLAGLDWSVVKHPVFVTLPDGTKQQVPNTNAVLRDSDWSVLGTVSDRYELLQNVEAFSFFEPFLHEQDCFISSAISLFNGRKIVICAQIEDNTREIVSNDTVKGYLILATSHDGSLGTIVKFTDVRVVCNNTLRAALGKDGAFRSIKHTKNQSTKLTEVQNTINLYKADFEEKVELYKTMANTSMTTEQFRSYLERTFSGELKEAAKRSDNPDTFRLEDYRSTKIMLWNYSSTPDLQMDGVAGTAWAGYNAVTEYLTHQKGNDGEKRVNSLLFGNDATVLEKASKFALL